MPLAQTTTRRANVSTFSVVDELEDMRTLATGHIEFQLSWPAVDAWGLSYDAYAPMEWTQDLNPALMWIEEKYTGVDAVIANVTLTADHMYHGACEWPPDTPWEERTDANFWLLCQYTARWGGLQYSEGGVANADALLDGAYGAPTSSGDASTDPVLASMTSHVYYGAPHLSGDELTYPYMQVGATRRYNGEGLLGPYAPPATSDTSTQEYQHNLYAKQTRVREYRRK